MSCPRKLRPIPRSAKGRVRRGSEKRVLIIRGGSGIKRVVKSLTQNKLLHELTRGARDFRLGINGARLTHFRLISDGALGPFPPR